MRTRQLCCIILMANEPNNLHNGNPRHSIPFVCNVFIIEMLKSVFFGWSPGCHWDGQTFPQVKPFVQGLKRACATFSSPKCKSCITQRLPFFLVFFLFKHIAILKNKVLYILFYFSTNIEEGPPLWSYQPARWIPSSSPVTLWWQQRATLWGIMICRGFGANS